MATSKQTARATPNGGTKRSFILRNEHASLSAHELVARAKAEGVILSPQLVHSVRYAARREAKSGRMNAVEMNRTIRRAGYVPPPMPPGTTEAKLGQLRRLIVEVGYDAAVEVFTGVGRELGR